MSTPRWSRPLVAFLSIALLFPWGDRTLNAQDKPTYAIVIHGGAGGNPANLSEERRQARVDGLARALDRGVALLASGTPAIAVVEEVVRVLEDDETFNAGRGCVLNELGQQELDASIMDGRDLACGAVAAVRRTKNPVSLARVVMRETRHVLLMGDAADALAESVGLEQADDDYFRTPRQLENWARWKAEHAGAPPERYLGTVGCVALDGAGDLAAADRKSVV